jgi:orotate phosphoribosyltransferase-like protein
MKKIDTEYLQDIFYRPKTTIKQIVRTIKKHYPEVQGIVSSSGISGSLLVVPVATELKSKFAIVRTKRTHSSCKVEGYYEIGGYVIIDDFIDSGTTVKQIIRKMKVESELNYPIGMVCYADYRSFTHYCKFDKICVPLPVVSIHTPDNYRKSLKKR